MDLLFYSIPYIGSNKSVNESITEDNNTVSGKFINLVWKGNVYV